MTFKRIALFLGVFTVAASSQVAFSKVIEDVKTIPAEILNLHIAQCPEFQGERAEMLTSEVFELPKSEYSSTTNELYVMGCDLYAYNSMGKAYIFNATYKSVTPVSVADVTGDGSIFATSDLMGVGYEPETLTLSTWQKGRGIGDCGSAISYTYDSRFEKFMLTEARVKDQCDGEETDWPIVYKK